MVEPAVRRQLSSSGCSDKHPPPQAIDELAQFNFKPPIEIQLIVASTLLQW
jgi:hypothetical protein